MKNLFLAIAILLTCAAFAQSTERKFTLKNSDDGQSEMTVYLPKAELSSGKAVVCCPGGGYVGLAMNHEGHGWAEFYNRQGIAFAVLKYRMPKGDRNIPLTDAYNAMRTMRDSATVWHVNPRAVGIMGSSAGGHLASAVSTHAPMEVRPDFTILFYPVISMDETKTHRGSCENFLGEGRYDKDLVKQWSSDRAVRRHLTPPAIILTASDDTVVPPVTNAIAYYSAMRNNGNDCALCVYPTGGHGFGCRERFEYHDQMFNDLSTWLATLNVASPMAQKIACIGNSITDGHGIDVAEQFGYPALLRKQMGEAYTVKNFGLSARTLMNRGDVPYQKEQAWKDCLGWRPDIAVIKLGTNDSKPQNRVFIDDDFAKDLQSMIDQLKAVSPNCKIYICSPIAAIKDSWSISDSVIVNQEMPIIQRIVKKNKCHFIDLHALFRADSETMLDDGIHPNNKGCALLADIIAKELKK